MFRYLFLLSVLIASTVAPAAQAAANDAQCAARIKHITVHGPASYAPFGLTETSMPVEIEVRDSDACRLSFVFKSAGGNRLGGRHGNLQYQLRSDAGRALETDGVTVRPAAGLGAGTNAGYRLLVVVPAGQTTQADNYQDRFMVRLMDGNRLLDEREVELCVRVVPQARIGVAGSARAGFSAAHGASMDFGILSTGTEREVYLFVQSNSAYALRLKSENAGALRNTTDGSAKSTISYSASLDGQRIDLSKPVTIHGRRHAFAQDPYALNAKIGDINGKPAGQYRDAITVDVIVLE